MKHLRDVCALCLLTSLLHALGASRSGAYLWLLSRRRGSCAVVLDPLGCNPLGALLGCLRSFLLLGGLVRVHGLVGAIFL